MRAAGSLRRRGRICALQTLYQMDISGDLLGTRVARGRAEGASRRFAAAFADSDPEATALAADIVAGVAGALLALDDQIARASHHWRLARMGVVDRNLLRLAAYEMGGERGLPKAIVVNEAVEIARLFGGADSPSFVNAMLDRLGPAGPAPRVRLAQEI